MKAAEIFDVCLTVDGNDYDCVLQDDKPDERLRALTESVLRRFVARLDKAGGRELDRHREILVDTLRPVTDQAEAEADAFLAVVREELQAVLPEQAQAVLARLDIPAWVERILT